MPWSDYPLRSITIPADPEPGSSYTFIGDDDPIGIAAGLDTAIVFHFGSANSAFLMGVTNEFGVHPDDGHFFITGRSDEMLNPYEIVNVDWQPGTLFGTTTFGDDAQNSSTAVVGYEFLGLNVTSNFDGYIAMNGHSVGYGLVATSVTLTASGAAVTAETVIATLPSASYAGSRAYRVRVEGGFTPSTTTSYADVRLKKLNTFGQTLGEFYRFPTCGVAATVTAMHGSRVFKVGNSSVTATLVVTMQTGAGTVATFATATSPFTVSVEDCGDSSFYPNAPTLV